MHLRFSEAVIIPNDERRRLFDIQQYQNLIFNVTYRPEEVDNLLAMPSLLNWTIVSFNELDIYIQLYFNKTLYVSIGEEQDQIQVEVLNPEIFVSKKTFQTL